MRLLLVLLRKVVYEQRWTLFLCLLMVGIFTTLGTYLYTTFGDTSMAAMSRISPQLVTGLFGGLFGGLSPLEAWLMTLFAHPLVLTLFSVVVIAISSRSLAGEIDRGTIDLLLSCPVPRWQPVIAAGLMLLLALAAMTAVVWWAMGLGMALGGIEPPASLAAFRWVAVNLLALFCAAGGVGLLFSAATSEQGRAMGRTLGFVVVSFFINLIAEMWQRVKRLDVVSIFHYYQAQPIVTSGEPAWRNLGVLFGVALLGLLAAIVVFRRRDIATV